MRFHVVSLPHTSLTAAFSACAFTDRTRKFANMMHDLGHQVFLYGGPKSAARCAEFVPCVTPKQRKALVGAGHYTETPWQGEQWDAYNRRVIAAIQARIQPRDFICLVGGRSQALIADTFPCHMAVEFAVGYGGVFSKFRVFESYAWMHTVYGSTNRDPCALDGRWYDAVIPPGYEVECYPSSEARGDYYLYVGRMIDRKGVQIAADVCRSIGARLVTAGPGEPPAGVDHRGVIGPAERGKLMSKAKALLAPTQYLEPFGNVAVEAMLCGTPVISTDWGAFTETVVHGETGYRCRTFAEFQAATIRALKLPRERIRDYAVGRYSMDAVARRYDEYFNRLMGLRGEGWTASI